MSGSVDFPVLACRDLLAGREFGKTRADSTSARYTAAMPGNAAMFKFFIGMYARKPVALFRILLTREQWNTGFLDSASLDPFSTTTARNVSWLPTKSVKDFAADPFFLRRDDKVTLLVEKLDPANNCGRIAAYLIRRGQDHAARYRDRGAISPLPTLAWFNHRDKSIVFQSRPRRSRSCSIERSISRCDGNAWVHC